MAKTIKDLKFDDRNFNKHTERGMELLGKSITENKFGRSILVDKDDKIIAGNATVEKAQELGKSKIIVVETTGEELVVVKRTDLTIDSKEARELALADNAVGKANLEWDEVELAKAKEDFGIVPEDWDVHGLGQWDELPPVTGEPAAPNIDGNLTIKVRVNQSEKDNVDAIRSIILDALKDYAVEIQ